ncbi:hypothetical protein XA67_13975 [Comamonas thiooxydans]|nr:hypothetical protein XA67_13975 [Comamonas thiooxydans]
MYEVLPLVLLLQVLPSIKLWQRKSRPGVEAMRHCIMMPVCDPSANVRRGLLAFAELRYGVSMRCR